MRRRLWVAFLFLCFVAPLAITFVMLEIQKNEVKNEVTARFMKSVDEQELVKLTFPRNQNHVRPDWKDDAEFEYQGEMYDVLKIVQQGDSISYWCWQDRKETKLSRQIDLLVLMELEHDPQKREHENRLFKFFDSLFFSETATCATFVAQAANDVHVYRHTPYESVCHAPPVAPPETA